MIALVDTLVGRIEPFVDGVPPMDEMPTIVEGSEAMTTFIGDRCPRQFHQFQADLRALKRKVVLV